MKLSYKKLWKLLIDKNLKKQDLAKMADISNTSIAKLGHDKSINTSILIRICSALECDITDILELVKEENN